MIGLDPTTQPRGVCRANDSLALAVYPPAALRAHRGASTLGGPL
jgi:hypothetical protein